MVVRQEAPGLTVRAVIFANRAPLPLTHIRSPQIPVTGLPQPILKPPEPGRPVTFSTHHGSMLVPAAPGRITRRGGKGPAVVCATAGTRPIWAVVRVVGEWAGWRWCGADGGPTTAPARHRRRR